MLKQLNRNKKKKGFTLIELVIVLAVLAIIALIAIPNFNKVRIDSQTKADLRTAEVIERVTLMAIADEDMVVDDAGGSIEVGAPGTGATQAVIGTVTGITWKTAGAARAGETVVGKDNYAKALKEISAPQVKGQKSYLVTINADESVEVTTAETDLAGE